MMTFIGPKLQPPSYSSIEEESYEFVIIDEKKYRVEEKDPHDTAWKVCQNVQDKWKQAISADKKKPIYTHLTPKNSATDKADKTGTALQPKQEPPKRITKPGKQPLKVVQVPIKEKPKVMLEPRTESPKVVQVPIKEKKRRVQELSVVREPKELPIEVRNFINEAKQEMTKISMNDLEIKLDQALQVGADITNPADKTTILIAAERVAQSYVKANHFGKALEMRMQAAQAIAPASPFSDLHLALSQEDPKLGLKLQPVDTSLFKNHSLALQRQTFTDGQTRLHVSAKLSHPAREQLQDSLQHIELNPKILLQALPKGFCTAVQVSTERTVYYGRTDKIKKWDGDFSFNMTGFMISQSDETVIHFDGVGKVKIGKSSNFVTEYNRISIDLDSDILETEAAAKLNIIFAALGLGAVSSSSRAEDIERIKVMQLFRAFYPKEAYSFERDAKAFEESIDSLKTRIENNKPDMKNKFQYYLVDHPELMYQQEVYPNQKVWCIDGLAQEVRNAGGMGLMSGVTANTFDDAINRLISILKNGALSTKDRFELGIIAAGLSSGADLKTGGGDSVFVRLLTKNMPKNPQKMPLAGKMQILYDLRLIERVGYAYFSDVYGTKKGKIYGNRSNVIELTQEIYQNPLKYLSNEICIRSRVGPTFIKGVIVQNNDERNQLLAALKNEELVTQSDSQQDCINGIPVTQFIRIGNFKPDYWT